MAKSITKGKTVQAKPKKEITKPAAKKDVKKETVKAKVKPEPKKQVTMKSEPKKEIKAKTLPKKQIEKMPEPKKTIPPKAEIKKVIKAQPAPSKKTVAVPEPPKALKSDKKTAPTKVLSKEKGAKEPEPKPEKTVEAEIKPVYQDNDDKTDLSIERKLVSLFSLQLVDTEINKIRIIRGELPLEVQDLEDEIAGLETRLENLQIELKEFDTDIKEKKTAIKDHQAQIKKYETQQMNVRNNREYDSLTKEIEFQTLEIQLCEKKIKEIAYGLDLKNKVIEETKQTLKDRKEDLKQKKLELDDIVTETEKEEKKLLSKLEENQKNIEERLFTAYQRIKKNARNGLAVVVVERDACGGCFNKIPPQRQLDIKVHKKIIVCEYCGRILIDKAIEEKVRGNN